MRKYEIRYLQDSTHYTVHRKLKLLMGKHSYWIIKKLNIKRKQHKKRKIIHKQMRIIFNLGQLSEFALTYILTKLKIRIVHSLHT